MKRFFGCSFWTLVSMVGIIVFVLMVSGCASVGKKIAEQAGSKNLDLSGYVLLGEIETANAETGTPQGKLITGRVTYSSRRVGIPADQVVPNTGRFRATRTKSIFGAEETIIEYDYTAGSDADAEKALKKMEENRKVVSKAMGDRSESRAASAKVTLTQNNKRENEVSKKQDRLHQKK